MYRGVSQTQGSGAVQGGLDIGHESGLYVGTWASNVNFGGDASVEFDYYAGFSRDLNETLSMDIGYVAYTYPGEAALNFGEYYGSLSAWGVTLGAAYSDDFGGNDTTLYSYIGYEYELPMDIGLSLSYGEYDFKDAYSVTNSESYNDWSVGLSKTLLGLDVGLAYTDTDMSSAECSGFAGDSDYCDSTFVLSVSKSL
jgi:uncharacterized protein (TIGR02001 family)